MKRTIYLAYVLLFLSFSINAQEKGDDNDETQIIDIPYFEAHISPPPEVNSFTDYSNSVGNNLFTGTMNYSIPLANIFAQNYSHSISLNYSSNGVRNFNRITPRFGNTWTLSAGGVITRTVNDNADDISTLSGTPIPGLLHNVEWYDKIKNNSLDDSDKASFADDAYLDSELDVFSFSFDGISGDFYIVPTEDSWEVVCNPVSNLKIIPIFEASGFAIISFEITTEKGLKYIFDVTESTDYDMPTASVDGRQINYISKWYLSSIENQAGETLLSFEYKSTV